MQPINEKLTSLRTYLKTTDLDAFIIPTNDPHFSEYVPSHYACREWISGFTGSAGTVVVTLDKAALFTDSRYFLQAESQLQNTTIELKKIGLPDSETIEQYLLRNVKKGGKVGLDKMLFTVNEFQKLEKGLQDLTLQAVDDPFLNLWDNRPSLLKSPAFILDKVYSGADATEKLTIFREHIGSGTTSILLALDEIAWLLNIRSTDVSYNPLAVAYAIIYPEKVALFIGDKTRFYDENCQTLAQQNIEILPYENFIDHVKHFSKEEVMVNLNKISVGIYQILLDKGCKITFEKENCGTITLLKSQKNTTEIDGFRKSMIADGVAMVKFLYWLNEGIVKESVTEYTIVKKLYEYRSLGKLFKGESFSSIVGHLENGAIVHYHVEESSAKKITPKGFLLIDSGGQYLTGTTDLTRTIHLSSPTDQEKRDYTLVLKGHIAIARAKFTAGMRGAQLDMLARQPLLQHNLNYLHGTGHGVGHFLCVHEGPQNIRMDENPVTLRPGMILSNEPGVYRTGQYGIRIENLVLVIEDIENEFGKFMKFETLTLCPIDTKPIDKSLLTEQEIGWINQYHQRVYSTLSPHIQESQVKEWLSTATIAI